MRNEIRVAKKFCERSENRFQDGYYVKMLPTSKYAGYRLFVSSYYFDLTATYGEILKSKNEGYLFTLEKIDRDPGKRYSRPKLSFDELQAEFAEHSAQFYSDALPQALALIKEYRNNGSRSAGEVLYKYLAVGGFDKTWFYVSDAERRRLNTNGVCIIKALTSDEATQIKEKLQRRAELRRMESKYEHCYVDYRDRYFYEEMQRTLKPDVLATITAKFDEINALVTAEAAEGRHELDDLEKYFEAFLEGSEGEE